MMQRYSEERLDDVCKRITDISVSDLNKIDIFVDLEKDADLELTDLELGDFKAKKISLSITALIIISVVSLSIAFMKYGFTL